MTKYVRTIYYEKVLHILLVVERKKRDLSNEGLREVVRGQTRRTRDTGKRQEVPWGRQETVQRRSKKT